MDAFDDESQVADSQATQLIDHLLDPENVSNYDPRPASFSSNLAVTNDSPGSPQNSASFPNYHFHGLADTQSQSPVHPFNGAHLDKLTQHIVIGEGSQKENIDTYSTDKDTTKAQLSASPLRASFSVSSKAANTDSRSHSLSKTTSRNVIKKSSTSALHSPSKPERTENKNTPLFRDPPTINRYKQRPRPKSRESSVDSFARDFSPDRRAEFIASVPQFHIPISELGRVLDATTDKAMPAYSKRGRNNVPRSSSQGIVLVESTPSNSSQSQSQSLSHQYIETQPLNPSQDPEFFGRQSFAPEPSDDGNDGYVSSSSSSINRLLEAPIPSPQLEPTQPATQPDEDLSIRNLDEEEEIEEAQQVLPPPAPTVRTTAPRSLLDSLPDAKRQRYQQFQRLMMTKVKHLTFITRAKGYKSIL
ncbi:hypothetical protein BDQ17DRAFT_427449 [Cyathus striatus]|nr:hypothetical protein BDQ17DRAFT_427449 [Cyathus striatus]